MSFALSFQKPAKPCGETERKLRETPDFGEMCVKSTQSKRGRKRSDEKSTCEVVENSDLSTAKSTGCGKVEISTQVFNRVWKTFQPLKKLCGKGIKIVDYAMENSWKRLFIRGKLLGDFSGACRGFSPTV